MKFHTDHLELAERLEHTRYEQLREFDHRPEYMDVRVVPSESSDTAYLVARVECLATPFGPDTDVAADRVEIPLCSCDDAWYHQTKGFEDGDSTPDEFGRCKHYRSAFRSEKAKHDDKQTELVNDD